MRKKRSITQWRRIWRQELLLLEESIRLALTRANSKPLLLRRDLEELLRRDAQMRGFPPARE